MGAGSDTKGHSLRSSRSSTASWVVRGGGPGFRGQLPGTQEITYHSFSIGISESKHQRTMGWESPQLDTGPGPPMLLSGWLGALWVVPGVGVGTEDREHMEEVGYRECSNEGFSAKPWGLALGS